MSIDAANRPSRRESGFTTVPLLLDPALRFAELAAVLESFGFRRDPGVRPFTPDTFPGEPELAAWTLGDGVARLTYTLNPVISLRVLMPAAVPDDVLALLASRLPHLDVAAVARLLAESEPRRILLGLFSARAIGAGELATEISRRCAHPDPLIARAARSTLESLGAGTGTSARLEALRLVQVLCRQAVPVLSALVGPDGREVIESMRPRAEDPPRVFLPSIVEPLRAAYEKLWRTPPAIDRLTSGSLTLKVDACPAGMLGDENELSRHFPGGYRALAPLLQPDRIWFVWRYLGPGAAAGMRYDGMVRIDDRWVWFPKPYRLAGRI